MSLTSSWFPMSSKRPLLLTLSSLLWACPTCPEPYGGLLWPGPSPRRDPSGAILAHQACLLVPLVLLRDPGVPPDPLTHRLGFSGEEEKIQIRKGQWPEPRGAGAGGTPDHM